ncbi:MAG TPA: CidA/LrgA family protein [Aliidongia sp.]|nr:CidA/LrgA family protein [Aliidongia sp.]
MLKAFTLLVICQLVGEVAAQASGLPLPGPVIGLLLLLGVLILTRGPDRHLEETSRGLLRYLPLLFVPAGVGVITQLDVLAREWLPVLAALFVSTALTLLVTALVMQHLAPAETDEQP